MKNGGQQKCLDKALLVPWSKSTAWLNNLGSIAEMIDELSLLQKGQNLEPTHT